MFAGKLKAFVTALYVILNLLHRVAEDLDFAEVHVVVQVRCLHDDVSAGRCAWRTRGTYRGPERNNAPELVADGVLSQHWRVGVRHTDDEIIQSIACNMHREVGYTDRQQYGGP